MTEANDQRESADDDSKTERRASLQLDDKNIPWRLVSFVAIAAVVLLVGLPIGAVLIVNLSGCCFANGPENVTTFWASMIAGFLTLFGMVVTGVFVLTSFKVEKTAIAEAQVVAGKEALAFLKRHKKKLFKELERTVDEVKQKAADESKELCRVAAEVQQAIKQKQSEAIDQITKASDGTKEAVRSAQDFIAKAQDETIREGRSARESIAGALDETTKAANGARAAIESAQKEVEQQRNDSVQAINRAQEDAEAAARSVREQLGPAAGGEADDRDGPRQPDE